MRVVGVLHAVAAGVGDGGDLVEGRVVGERGRLPQRIADADEVAVRVVGVASTSRRSGRRAGLAGSLSCSRGSRCGLRRRAPGRSARRGRTSEVVTAGGVGDRDAASRVVGVGHELAAWSPEVEINRPAAS